jgi:hypothetical protein
VGATGGCGWLVAVVAMVGAVLLMVPTAWAYVVTHIDHKKKYDRSVVQTLLILPIAVAATLVIVQDSLAVAFSLAGIATPVRFRNALEDTKDAVYIFVAIAVGLGAGVGALEAGAALSTLFNLVVVALWKWHTASRAKRWSLEAEDRDAEGGTSITYYVRLKKSQSPNRLLDELRERLGGRLAELHQAPKADQDKR